MKISYLCLLITFGLSSCASNSGSSYGKYDHRATNISMIELIGSGSEYDGWQVRVIGVASYSAQEHSLVVFADSFSHSAGDVASTVGVRVKDGPISSTISAVQLERMDNRTIMVEGTFRYIPRVRLASNEISIGMSYIGVIEDVNYISVE